MLRLNQMALDKRRTEVRLPLITPTEWLPEKASRKRERPEDLSRFAGVLRSAHAWVWLVCLFFLKCHLSNEVQFFTG